MLDTVERDDTKILVCHAVNKNELWSDVFGSGLEHYEWWLGVEFLEGDWNVSGIAKVTYLNEDNKRASKLIGIVDIANAYSSLASSGWEHCCGDSIDEPDGCTSDAIMQVAIFNELIYS